VRRRADPDAGRWPDWLTRYRADDWPTGCHPECAYWAAVAAWREQHPGEELPTLPGPDVPLHRELL